MHHDDDVPELSESTNILFDLTSLLGVLIAESGTEVASEEEGTAADMTIMKILSKPLVFQQYCLYSSVSNLLYSKQMEEMEWTSAGLFCPSLIKVLVMLRTFENSFILSNNGQ